MKESELLELAAAKRYRSLRDKRAEAAIKANNWNLPTVTVRASRRHVAAFTLEMAALAEDGSLAERYYVYGSEAITSIKNLAPLEGNFPSAQIDEWRATYTAQVTEALEFFKEFQPDSPEANQLQTAAFQLRLIEEPVRLIEEPVNETVKDNGYRGSSVAGVAVRTSVEIITDNTPQPEEPTLEGPSPPEDQDEVTPAHTVVAKKPTLSHKSQTVAKPKLMDPRDVVVRPRSPFHSKGALRHGKGDAELSEPKKSRKYKGGPKQTTRRGSERSNPLKSRGNRLTEGDHQKIDIIRQAAEAMAASYFESNLGTDPERSHRSTQLRVVFPKFTPGLIYEASPKLNHRGANSGKNFKLSEAILILLHGSRITQNIILTKKYRGIIPEVIDQAIAKALKSKQELDNIN